MAATTGITGLLSATGASTTKELIDAINPYTASLSINSAEIDVSAFAASLVFSQYVQDLYDWNITTQGRFPTTAQAAFNCSVSQSGTDLYLTNVTGFSVDFSVPVVETTDLSASAAKTFTYGGPLQGRFTINARVDGTTALQLPTVSLAQPGHDVTFTIGSEATNDDVIAVDGSGGGARILSVSPTVALGSTNDVTITGIFSGAVQIKGDNPIFAVSAPQTLEDMDLPAVTTVALQAAASRTYTGSAFWSAFSVSAQLGSAIDVSATLQGTGALTIG